MAEAEEGETLEEAGVDGVCGDTGKTGGSRKLKTETRSLR
jgi:hypothetical protein